MKKETLEKFKANPAQRKKFYQDEMNKLMVQLASLTKDREDAEKQRDGNKKKIADLSTKEIEKNDERETL